MRYWSIPFVLIRSDFQDMLNRNTRVVTVYRRLWSMQSWKNIWSSLLDGGTGKDWTELLPYMGLLRTLSDHGIKEYAEWWWINNMAVATKPVSWGKSIRDCVGFQQGCCMWSHIHEMVYFQDTKAIKKIFVETLAFLTNKVLLTCQPQWLANITTNCQGSPCARHWHPCVGRFGPPRYEVRIIIIVILLFYR